ncbi:MAG: hypothetical protein A2015_16030 [Spirochaetes bacterium GWF1_31_7]|nr:MAG: hypothetical protein A2Y30_13405 [Spirochaetes bacterium GWE1_32_154]OHD49963.1 MAG: hypothetical protein A2Y29_11450 [Spirochaetes bacterium GWE2_31_10]OHD52280.1 MAG: hypothetical protein A2015_16030 [Spirochaetes bacterium GWF1_31_7]OHD72981.1 MAG: hypothetical protein A2355_07045 [Spirochaetes bacterium RIFOXYB1_FULL_32_8]HBD96445.1 hypothetical protein [Spirochaetia bacterium]
MHTISELWEKQCKTIDFNHTKKNILIYISDDSQIVCSVIEKNLKENGFTTEVFTTIEKLVDRIKIKKPDVILLDFYFEESTSLEFIQNYAQSIPIICMSTTENPDDLNLIFNNQIVDFIPKPIHSDILCLKINNFTRRIEQMKDFETIQVFIDSLLYTIEIRDIYTRGHSERVSCISEHIAKYISLDEQQVQIIKRGALLHDIGKVGVRDSVLLKAGSLSNEEFAEIKNHTVFGYNTCINLNSFHPYLSIIRSHHEKLDGSGYPDGLKGSEIPIEVQIVSIADVFDALTSKRVYRDALSLETAFKILFEEYKKGFWDVEIINALRSLSEKKTI